MTPPIMEKSRFGDDAFSMHCYGNHPLFLEGSEIGRGCVARQKRARDHQKISTLLIRDVASRRQMLVMVVVFGLVGART